MSMTSLENRISLLGNFERIGPTGGKEAFLPGERSHAMLISRQVVSEADDRQGSRISFVELRGQLAAPSANCDGHRRRLLDLARRLARVQTLGDEYRRVCFSPHVEAAMDNAAVVTH